MFSDKLPHLEGRSAAIFDVNVILNEILNRVVIVDHSSSCFYKDKEVATKNLGVVLHDDQALTRLPEHTRENENYFSIGKVAASSPLSSSNARSFSSDTDSSCSLPSEDQHSNKDATIPDKVGVETKKTYAVKEIREVDNGLAVDITDTLAMVNQCLSAINECISRFSHFYKGHYRLSHYYFHSKSSRNIEACRELLFGRPLSASIAQLQQRGITQSRFLPNGAAGLFAEWRQYLINIC